MLWDGLQLQLLTSTSIVMYMDNHSQQIVALFSIIHQRPPPRGGPTDGPCSYPDRHTHWLGRVFRGPFVLFHATYTCPLELLCAQIRAWLQMLIRQVSYESNTRDMADPARAFFANIANLPPWVERRSSISGLVGCEIRTNPAKSLSQSVSAHYSEQSCSDTYASQQRSAFVL